MAAPALPQPPSRRTEKSAAAFRTISEVARGLELPQHVLRFWESKFSHIKPLKRGGGRRFYRPEDVELLRRIRELLYVDGYTIKGVQKLLREEQKRPGGGRAGDVVAAAASVTPLAPRQRRALEVVLADIEQIKRLL